MSKSDLSKRIQQRPIFLVGDEFSDVSEEKTSELEEADKDEEEEEDLSWRSFHREKIGMNKLKKHLVSMYVDYRRNLVEAVREFCSETNNRAFDHAQLTKSQEVFQMCKERFEELQEGSQSQVEEKVALVDKLLSERRIKRYYKSKYEINFRDELDPDDQQHHIYEYYEQIFSNNATLPNVALSPSSSPHTVPHHFASHLSRGFPTDENDQETLQDPKSPIFQEKAIPTYKTNQLTDRNSDNKKRDLLLGGHEVSFDVRNEQFKRQESFEEKVGQEERSGLFSKQELSGVRDTAYKNFISQQNQQLLEQRQKVQELTEKAMKVLNNDDVEDEDFHEEELLVETDKASQLKFLLGELIEVFSVAQCLRHQLKYKSFELVNKLYQHASAYYEEDIEFEEPITVKHFSQIVSAAMPDQQEEALRVVIENIFGCESAISFEQFVEKLSPSINDHEFKLIEDSMVSPSGTSILDLTVRLFELWIELEYFQKSIKDLLHSNPVVTEKFLGTVSEDGAISPALVVDFVLRGKKSKTRKLKVELFLKSILGEKFKNSEFYRWVETRKIPLNSSYQQIKEDQQYEYFYNLY